MDYFVMIVVLIFDYFGSSQSADKVSLFYLWYIVLSLTAKCTEIRNLRSCNLSILNNSKIREDLVNIELLSCSSIIGRFFNQAFWYNYKNLLFAGPSEIHRGESVGVRCMIMNRSPYELETVIILKGSSQYKFIHVEDYGYVVSYAPR